MHNWPKLLFNPSGLLFTFYLCSNLRQVDTLSTDNRQSKFSHTATNSGPSLSQQLALVNNTPCQEQTIHVTIHPFGLGICAIEQSTYHRKAW